MNYKKNTISYIAKMHWLTKAVVAIGSGKANNCVWLINS